MFPTNHPMTEPQEATDGRVVANGQEFVPARDPIQSLREAVRICDV